MKDKILIFPKPGSEAYQILDRNLQIIADAQWDVLGNLIQTWDKFTDWKNTYWVKILWEIEDDSTIKLMEQHWRNNLKFWKVYEEITTKIANTLRWIHSPDSQFTVGNILSNTERKDNQRNIDQFLESINAEKIDYPNYCIEEEYLNWKLNEWKLFVRVNKKNSYEFTGIASAIIIKNADSMIDSILNDRHRFGIMYNLTYYMVNRSVLEELATILK
jgi:hypothetical protein